MWNQVALLLLQVFGFVDQAACCEPRELIPAHDFDHPQFLGKWYQAVIVGRYESDIAVFEPMDSLWFSMENIGNDTMLVKTHIRKKGNEGMGKCMNVTWHFAIHRDTDQLGLNEMPFRTNYLWSGLWANCPECYILEETVKPQKPSDTEDVLDRMILHVRQSETDPDIVDTFLRNAACIGMTVSRILPREEEFCD